MTSALSGSRPIMNGKRSSTRAVGPAGSSITRRATSAIAGFSPLVGPGQAAPAPRGIRLSRPVRPAAILTEGRPPPNDHHPLPAVTSFRFCPRCGIELVPDGRCPRCGESVVPRTVPAVGMAVVESGQILLVQRRWEPMVGHWSLPAGFIEGHEAPAATARREVAEETGLIVRPVGLFAAYGVGGA